MEPDGNVEALPSADNGNIPVDAPEAPNPEPKPDAPAENGEPAQPAEPQLFELPDGRKVDAETLTREWKENFLPDYTRKSQALAARDTLPTEPTANPYANPDYVPQTYAEIIDAAKVAALQEIESKEQAKLDQQRAIEGAVASQLEEVKKIDPSFNENALFLHANKYGFRDLRVAHQNMRDMSEMAKKVKQTTASDIAKRSDPVSATPGATGGRPDPSGFETAAQYLRSLKN